MGGAVYVSAVVYLSGLVPEDYVNTWFIGMAALLWAACAWMGWRRAPFPELFAAITGLTWGLIVAALVSFRLVGAPIVINWTRLLVFFAAAPVLVLITVLPLWFMGKQPASTGGG